MVTSIKTKKGAEALAFSNKLETLRKHLLNDYINGNPDSLNYRLQFRRSSRQKQQ